MNRNQQILKSLKVYNLKSLNDLEISFEGKSVTGILGPNGNGKSTILHALACAFKPQNTGENYRFSNFFLPSTNALWNNSHFEIEHSFSNQGNVTNNRRRFLKTEIRWTPRYNSRPVRDLYFIGIDKCVPMIEKEKRHARINYSTSQFTAATVQQILDKASYILNKRYETLNIHKSGNKEFIGVVSQGLQYSAISMSAGEQKVFYVLEKLFNAEKYSLILIDELDLLLHDLSFKRLIEVAVAHADKKNIQIIFTTHRESVIDLEELINVRHVVNRNGKSLCFNETKPAAIDRLTGTQSKPLEFFVEDDLSEAIVRKISTQNKIGKYVSITIYGACINSFSIAAGLLLSGSPYEKIKIVLDGDLYITDAEQDDRISKVITGNDDNAIALRLQAKSLLQKYNLPNGFAPEHYIHSVIRNIQEGENQEFNEIIETANDIGIVDNDHKYINDIIDRIGWDKKVGLAKIIDLFSTTNEWLDFTTETQEWTLEQRNKIMEGN